MTTKLLKQTTKSKKLTEPAPVENITLEQLLTAYFGKNKVKVVPWRWTDEQLQQLEKPEKRPKK